MFLIAACCPEGRLRNAGIVYAAARDADRWRSRLGTCDDAPVAAGEVQIVGRIDLSKDSWQSTLLGCWMSGCCNEMSPLGFGVITRSTGGDIVIRSVAVEVCVGPNPWSWSGRLDCQWEPWERVLRSTSVRATGTMDGDALRVRALCRMP
jgi:hypothetical protein